MPDDSLVPVDEPQVPDGPVIPKGSSPIHQRHDSTEIWRLCCRLRLDMRENGLGIRDAHEALLMAYPDLKIKQTELKAFMESYVDESIIMDAGFFKKGLMTVKAKLNAVAEAAKLAEAAQKAVERIQGPVGLDDLPKYTLAVERAQKMRERQFRLMSEVGMGPPTDQDRASHAKPSAAKPPAPINYIEHATFNLSEGVGGSFARRAAAFDAEGKTKA